jgi:multidrug efflux pump subunit AcrB
VVLIGLTAKNAILIVEFAKQLQDQGKGRHEAIIEACRVRLRPILMTSLAFILGVLPLVRAAGAGAEMRFALGVPFFGLLFTPVFYEVIRGWRDRRAEAKAATAPPEAAPHPTSGG